MSRSKPPSNAVEAFLGLGSNLGDRADTLRSALQALEMQSGLWVIQVSSLYESAPVGIVEQPEFLNLVTRIATTLDPHLLLTRCLEIEARLGRVRRERWGPRVIDIDLLLHGDLACDEPALTVPHPRMTERSFVVVPLAEIAPDRLVAGRSAFARAATCDHSGLRSLGSFAWREVADTRAGTLERP
jgi:2-amino-4-hydroxy-6-hydroxymethyldihydropteridine diphosphokinase